MNIKNFKLRITQLLKWTERYTKTDMVYVARGSFWIFIGQFFTLLTAFFLSLAFANLLSKEIFGEYKYILSLTSMLGMLALAGMGTAVTQAAAKGCDGTLKKSVIIQLKWGILISVVAAGTAIYYFIQKNNIFGVTMLIAGFFYPFMNAFNTYTAFLNGKKKFKKIALYGILTAVYSSFFIFLSIIIWKKTLGLILMYFLFNALATFYFYKKTISTEIANDEHDEKSISYGKHLSLMGALAIASSQIDKILIFHYLGSAQVAIYIFAVLVPDNIQNFFKTIQVLSLPKFTKKSLPEIKVGLYRKLLIVSLSAFLLTIIYIVCSPLFFKIFFPQYINSVAYTQIYSLYLISAPASMVILSILRSQYYIKKMYFYNVSNALIKIFLMCIGISFGGLSGLIVAIVISSLIELFIGFLLIEKKIPVGG